MWKYTRATDAGYAGPTGEWEVYVVYADRREGLDEEKGVHKSVSM